VSLFGDYVPDVVNFVDCLQIELRGSPYQGDEGELLLRVNFLSLQTIPVGMRSLPRFDYQVKHLLRSRFVLSNFCIFVFQFVIFAGKSSVKTRAVLKRCGKCPLPEHPCRFSMVRDSRQSPATWQTVPTVACRCLNPTTALM
jgi:hypothetical protein